MWLYQMVCGQTTVFTCWWLLIRGRKMIVLVPAVDEKTNKNTYLPHMHLHQFHSG